MRVHHYGLDDQALRQEGALHDIFFRYVTVIRVGSKASGFYDQIVIERYAQTHIDTAFVAVADIALANALNFRCVPVVGVGAIVYRFAVIGQRD